MPSLPNRLAKLEAIQGKDDLDRRINSLTEEQIEARIAELTMRLRHDLMTAGVDCTALADDQCVAMLKRFDAEGWPAKAELENNQDKS